MADNFNPDDPVLKDKIVSKDGSTGGMLVGNRHHEANQGISAINMSTGQPIKMEGGEVVITRNAVSDPTKRSFNGQMLTNRQILSKINESGGGVQFAEDGAELPTTINCSGSMYEFGGLTMSDIDVIQTIYKEGGSLSHTDLVNDFENDLYNNIVEPMADDLEAEGTTKLIAKYLQDKGVDFQIKVGEISEAVGEEIEDSFFPHFWVETNIGDETYIVDFKSRLWMDDNAPEGVIRKSDTGRFLYDGITKKIPNAQLENFYKIQSR